MSFCTVHRVAVGGGGVGACNSGELDSGSNHPVEEEPVRIRDWFHYHVDCCVPQHHHQPAAVKEEDEEEELVQPCLANSVVEDALNLGQRLVDEPVHAGDASSDDSKLHKANGDHLQQEEQKEEDLGE